MNDFLEITDDNIEKIDRIVLQTSNYGNENMLIHSILNKYPLNNNVEIVALKIALIDLTNSTHIAQYKSKISLYDLANVIVNIPNFDERVKNGDPELVNVIAKNNGSVNLFSFASKYCTYHNYEIYNRDDYSIFDGVVKNTLPMYINGLSKHKINSWRVKYDYKSFNDCIGELLDAHNITVENRRRKFDHFMWWPNRGSKVK